MSSSPAKPQPDLLTVSGLGFRVGGVEILRDVTLRVREGSLLGIIGPNGAGKTTFLNLVSGVLLPTSGRLEVDHHDVTKASPATRAKLGVGRSFQTSSLFNALSVFENARLSAQVRFGGNSRAWQRPRASDPASLAAMDALETVGLRTVAASIAGTLSHGEKRKLELAILLAAEARLLLLDEPMAGVNSDDVPQLSALIARLHHEGRTVLMVEHHMSVVVGLADRIAVFDSGRLLAVGEPDEVIANEAVQSAYLGQPL